MLVEGIDKHSEIKQNKNNKCLFSDLYTLTFTVKVLKLYIYIYIYYIILDIYSNKQNITKINFFNDDPYLQKE